MYNEALINNFINGNLPFLEREQLFNDVNFMKEVFLITHDKYFYSPCSHDVKNNIDFVFFISKIFKDDVNFVFKVIDYYLKYNTTRNNDYLKIMIIVKKLLKDNYEELYDTYYISYQNKLLNIYETYDSFLENATKNASESEKKFSGLGFSCILNSYGENDIIDFVAERILYKLFYTFDFELYIHNKYNSKEELLLKNVNSVLLDYLSIFDKQLFGYVCNKKELLKDATDRLNQVIENFDNFNNNKKNQLNISLDNYLIDNDINYTYKIDLIKMEELKRVGLDEKFYGQKIEDFKFINEEDNVYNIEEEKIRLFIRKEIRKIFNIKVKNKLLKEVEDRQN